MKNIKKPTAIILCVLMIALSIFFGGRMSLNKIRNQALSLFYEGNPDDQFDLGIEYDLERRIAFAGNLVTVAKRYTDSNNALITAVQSACDSLNNASDPSDKYKYNQALTTACNNLSAFLDTQSLSVNDAKYNTSIKADMESANQIIGHSDYNTKAAEFNQILRKFPTNILCKITFVEPLKQFAY